MDAKNIKPRSTPPVLILGGRENALAMTRSLGRRGIVVRAVCGEGFAVAKSRFLTEKFIIPPLETGAEYFRQVTLSGKYPHLKGSVIFAGDDVAIEFMIKARPELAKDYILDCHIPEKQLDMLHKQKTLQLARSIGIPAPQFWSSGDINDVEAIAEKAVFPVIIKPHFSHQLQELYDKKLFYVENKSQLITLAKEIKSKNIDFMICEYIPGADTNNSSYYTHIDEQGNNLFKYTKRVIRRNPPNFGSGCYHESMWMPETAELGEKYFRGIGFRGLCNIEFKYDARDKKLKLIEINARITAAHELLIRSGMDVGYLVYCHLTKQPLPPRNSFKERLTLWYPLNDLNSFLLLRGAGKMKVWQWIRSWLRPQVFPYFQWSDPRPFFSQVYLDFKSIIVRRLNKYFAKGVLTR